MLFSSLTFLYVFLPLVVILYFVVPKSWRNAELLLFSLLFYAWGEPKMVLLMVAVVLCGYVFGLLLGKWKKKWLVALSTAVFLGILGFFKYCDFFIVNFNAVTGLSVPLLRVALPLGISFYTFQVLSYEIDVYRGTVPPQKNFIDFATYVALFPQLVAGPIVRYSDIALQMKDRETSLDRFSAGLKRFLYGLSKKVLFANGLGAFVDAFRTSSDGSVLFYWLYAIAFTLQIYFDFSGYSDMAIGLGKVFGFDFPENFDYPYLSKSATEFWRRWHKTLGGWFRDYVYIPLGGNRVKPWKHIFNICVVWFLTGFWHGADWNFILWGLLFAILLIVEKFWLGKYLNKSKVLSHVYLMFFIVMSFVLFNADGVSGAISDFVGLFGGKGLPACSKETLYYLKSYLVLFLVSIVAATPLAKNLAKKANGTKVGHKICVVAEPILLALLLLSVTAYLVDGSFNPFLYFRF